MNGEAALRLREVSRPPQKVFELLQTSIMPLFYLVSHSQMASLKSAIAAIRLARTNRLFLSESECHTLCTITTIRWMKYIISETNISKYSE